MRFHQVASFCCTATAFSLMGCSQAADCATYQDCVMPVTFSSGAVDKTTGGSLVATISNYANETPGSFPAFLLQQANVPDAPLMPSPPSRIGPGQYAFHFNLTCDQLAPFDPGSVNFKVQTPSSIGPVTGMGSFVLSGPSISFAASPDVQVAVDADMSADSFWKLIDVGYLDNVHNIVTLQEANNYHAMGINRKILFYDKQLKVISSAGNNFDSILTSTKAAIATRNNGLLFTSGYGTNPPKLRLNLCPKIMNVMELDCPSLLENGNPAVLDNADGLALSPDATFILANDQNQKSPVLHEVTMGILPAISMSATADNLMPMGPVITLLDVDGDGDEDLVHLRAGGNAVDVYENNGKQAFANSELLTQKLNTQLSPLGISSNPITTLRSGHVYAVDSKDLIVVQQDKISLLHLINEDCYQLSKDKIETPKPVTAVTSGDIKSTGTAAIIAISSGPNTNAIYVYQGITAK